MRVGSERALVCKKETTKRACKNATRTRLRMKSHFPSVCVYCQNMQAMSGCAYIRETNYYWILIFIAILHL